MIAGAERVLALWPQHAQARQSEDPRDFSRSSHLSQVSFQVHLEVYPSSDPCY
jgi:hypothetical protein